MRVEMSDVCGCFHVRVGVVAGCSWCSRRLESSGLVGVRVEAQENFRGINFVYVGRGELIVKGEIESGFIIVELNDGREH